MKDKRKKEKRELKMKKKKEKKENKKQHNGHGEHKVNCASWGCKCMEKREKIKMPEKKVEVR